MEKTFYNSYFELEKDNWWFRVRRNMVFWLISNKSNSSNKSLIQHPKIFDFGCGSGFLVGELQKRGYDAHGMDFEAEAINYGLESGIKNLLVGKGDKINFDDGSFDVITSLDVLEHLEDEKPTIKELVRMLKPGGTMIVTVPAYMWLWGLQDEISHHYRRYTGGSLQKLFSSHPNLRVIKRSYFNTFLFPAIAAVRLLSKLFRIKNRESDFDINNNFINKLLYFIFNCEARLLRYMNFPFGSSILLVLKKS